MRKQGRLLALVLSLAIALTLMASANVFNAVSAEEGGKFVKVYENNFDNAAKYNLNAVRTYGDGVIESGGNGTISVEDDATYGKVLNYTKGGEGWHRPLMRVGGMLNETDRVYEFSVMAKLNGYVSDFAFQTMFEVTDDDGYGVHTLSFGDWYDYLINSTTANTWTNVKVYFKYTNDGTNYTFYLAKSNDFTTEGNYVTASYASSKKIAAIEYQFVTGGGNTSQSYFLADLTISKLMTAEELANQEYLARVWGADFTTDCFIAERVDDVAGYPGQIAFVNESGTMAVVDDSQTLSGKALDVSAGVDARVRLGSDYIESGKTYKLSYKVKMTDGDKFNGNFGMLPLFEVYGSDGFGNYPHQNADFNYNYLGGTIQSTFHEEYFTVEMYFKADVVDSNLQFTCFNSLSKVKSGTADLTLNFTDCGEFAALNLIWWRQGGSTNMPWRLADVSVSEYKGNTAAYTVSGTINMNTRVILKDAETMTAVAAVNAAEGAYTFENVVPGNYVLYSETTGLAENLVAKQTVTVTNEDVVSQLVLATPKYSVSATLDSGVTVKVYSWNGLDGYDLEGTYTELPISLKKGSYIFEFSKEGYTTLTLPQVTGDIADLESQVEGAVTVEKDTDLGEIELQAITPPTSSDDSQPETSETGSTETSVNGSTETSVNGSTAAGGCGASFGGIDAIITLALLGAAVIVAKKRK